MDIKAMGPTVYGAIMGFQRSLFLQLTCGRGLGPCGQDPNAEEGVHS